MPSATKVQLGYVEAINPFSLAPGTVSAPTLTFTNDSNSGIYSPSLGALGFVTNSQDALTILPNGNVGIATTTPAHKLDVNGSINTTGYYFTNGGLDYGLIAGYGSITTAVTSSRDYGGLT